MQQGKLTDRRDAEASIDYILAKLKRDGEEQSVLLEIYSKWGKLSDVPDKEIMRLKADLEAEVRAREALGDERFFAARGKAGKDALYENALKAMCAVPGQSGGCTFAEYRRKLTACLLMVDVEAEKTQTQEAPIKKRVRKLMEKKPTRDELISYALEKRIQMDVDAFLDHYESNSWKIGKMPMADWRAAARNWARRDAQSGGRPFAKLSEHALRNKRPSNSMPSVEQVDKIANLMYVPMKTRKPPPTY